MNQLYKVWEGVNHIGGWLRLLEMTGSYNPQDIRELEQIDEDAIAVEKECKDYYYHTEAPKIKQQTEEFINEAKSKNPNWVNERRLNYLNQLLKNIGDKIEEGYQHYYQQRKKDVPYFFRMAVLEANKTPELEIKRKKAQAEIYYITLGKKIIKDKISQEEIERALNYPFENLIEIKKHIREGEGFAICPFHSERKPSFYIKNNWGFCFGCSWNGDTIKFVMKKDDLTFPEAIRRF